MNNSWEQQLEKKIANQYKKGNILKKYAGSFPPGYQDDFTVSMAITDIEYMEKLNSDNQLELKFYLSKGEGDEPLHLRIYQWSKPIALADILPMLENLGLRTLTERPHEIEVTDHPSIWISDFTVSYKRGELDLHKVQPVFQEAFKNIYAGKIANDGFNKLILAALLSWRETMLLRAYAKYLHQVGFRFSQSYIEDALIDNPDITVLLIQLFVILHNPHAKQKTKKAITIETEIFSALSNVKSLDEDKIIRRLVELIKATLRTNFFQLDEHGAPKSYIALKLNSRQIPELPKPIPLYEIFIYSPRFEGIHLRNTKVARGGIRWSSRLEDFRTEILGLMKAQTVKNAVIVPSGAKGGFVLKQAAALTSRESLQAEVITCYKLFISGLLDITDNLINKKIIKPQQVVCYDDDDPYLVVAADKGTATFSDIANEISAQYNFWLADAFASGGSTGYDHKKLGITARGSWESIKRHFREIDLDINKDAITTVGIGDMSGDVFGNGMLYHKNIKLVAAFDHRHIFLDPNPKLEAAYKERQRLFKLSASSWADYDNKLISTGGGVYARTLKSIPVSPEMQAILGINDKSLAPNELIQAILRAPVELLFNGGIGTYVKASTETNVDVGDRTNDYCRVNGAELRCKIVGEGGNLGFTQLGRVEFALKGGVINTDFIDNSAGVDCSDHEVNLKLLLNSVVAEKKLTLKARNTLLASLSEDVANLVINDNYEQALVMSYSAFDAKKYISLHSNYLQELETQGIIDRQIEFLPNSKALLERKKNGLGLTRPELAILLEYTKIYIKHAILASDLPEDTYISHVFNSAFPASLHKKYASAMLKHPLRRDIIATQLSNQMVNRMGFTFVYRLQMETGATIAEIVKAYTVSAHIFNAFELQKLIESLDYKVPLAEQYDMLYSVRQLINLSTRWFLHGTHLQGNLANLISHYAERIKILEVLTPNLMSGATKKYLTDLKLRFIEAGVPAKVAQHIATYRAIYTSLNIIEVSTRHKFDLERTAKVYYAAGEKVNLLWFRDQISNDSRDGHWNVLARLTLRDELDIAQRAITFAIMQTDRQEKDIRKLINKWISNNKRALNRWDRLLAMLHASTNVDYTMFFIAMRELIGLILTSHKGESAANPRKDLIS